MKTPDEIKRGLEACAEDDCRDCAYYKGKATCLQGMIADALAYIKRLEAERDAQKADIAALIAKWGKEYSEGNNDA